MSDSSAPSASPPDEAPGSMRNPHHPRVTNFLQEEVALNIESYDNMGSNLDLDPKCLESGYKYRWVYRAPVKVSRAKAKGYAVVNPATHPKRLRNFAGEELVPAEDGTLTVGDVVLMRSKKDVYINRRKKLKRQTKEKLDGQVGEFKAKAKRAAKRARLSQGIRTITNEDEEK
jgi:hypothetical protein